MRLVWMTNTVVMVLWGHVGWAYLMEVVRCDTADACVVGCVVVCGVLGQIRWAGFCVKGVWDDANIYSIVSDDTVLRCPGADSLGRLV